MLTQINKSFWRNVAAAELRQWKKMFNMLKNKK